MLLFWSTPLYSGEWTSLIANTAAITTLTQTNIQAPTPVQTGGDSILQLYTLVEISNANTSNVYIQQTGQKLSIYGPKGIKRSYTLPADQFNIDNIVTENHGSNVMIKIPVKER